jgi:hypothetical protein
MKKLILILILALAWSAGATKYYVDFSAGSDANNGTAKATPWKYCPGMLGATGLAASHTWGADTFFFKGGVTWDSTAFPMEVHAGAYWDGGYTFTIDSTWYNGGTFTRPIFDIQYKILPQVVKSFFKSHPILFNGFEIEHQNGNATDSSNSITFSLSGCDSFTVQNTYCHTWKTQHEGDTCIKDDNYSFMYAGNSKYLTVTNCQMIGVPGSQNVMGNGGSFMWVGADNVPGLKVTHCKVNWAYQGIIITGTHTDCEIGYDTILNIYQPINRGARQIHTNGFFNYGGGSGIIHDCYIDSMNTCEFHFSGGVWTVYNNIVLNSIGGACSDPYWEVYNTPCPTCTLSLYNNTFATGFHITGGNQRANVGVVNSYNNIFQGGDQLDTAFTTMNRDNNLYIGFDSNTVTNYIIYKPALTSLTYSVAQARAAGWDQHSVWANTLAQTHIAYSGEDSANSITLGKGKDLSAFLTKDYRGTTRAVPFSIGAYQYNGCTPSTITGLVFTDTVGLRKVHARTYTGSVDSFTATFSNGMAVNKSTGADSGTPTATMVKTAVLVTLYDHTCQNVNCWDSVTIIDTAKTSITYPSGLIGRRGITINPQTPTLKGTHSSIFFVRGPYAGLSINTTTGVISGTPNVKKPKTGVAIAVLP